MFATARDTDAYVASTKVNTNSQPGQVAIKMGLSQQEFVALLQQRKLIPGTVTVQKV
jgi:hypothetical protein